MDFVIKLPKSVGLNIVMTVVDSVPKRTYSILTYTTVNIEGTVRLFLHNVWKLHSFPTYIILDREP